MGADRFTRPPGLRPGDRIAVIAPASPFDRPSFEAGLRVLAERYRPVVDEGCFARVRYLAGDDARRLDELTAALGDDSVRAIVAARGGYGTLRLLARLWPKLQVDSFPPKPVVGFSDITALHLALQAAGWVSIHGPVVTQLGTQPPAVVDRLVHLLESPATPAPPLRGTPLAPGLAEGPLLGGNLSLLTRLLGTRHLPSLDGAILLLEDVNEAPYKVDRMLTHLRRAGALRGLAGVALGHFTNCDDQWPTTIVDVLTEHLSSLGVPVLGGLPIGHGADQLTVALGTLSTLDADANTLIVEAAGR